MMNINPMETIPFTLTMNMKTIMRFNLITRVRSQFMIKVRKMASTREIVPPNPIKDSVDVEPEYTLQLSSGEEQQSRFPQHAREKPPKWYVDSFVQMKSDVSNMDVTTKDEHKLGEELSEPLEEHLCGNLLWTLSLHLWMIRKHGL